MPGGQGDAEQVRSAMIATPLLAGVPKAAVERLATSGRVRQYRKGTYLCHQGDVADEIFFLLRGRVEISSISVTGSRVLHATVDTPAVRRRARRARRDRSDRERAHARGLGASGSHRPMTSSASSRASRPPPGACCGSWRDRCSRTRRSSTTSSSSISRDAWPSGSCRWRPRRSTIFRRTDGRYRRSRTPTSRASAAAAARTSRACSPSSSVVACCSATGKRYVLKKVDGLAKIAGL